MRNEILLPKLTKISCDKFIFDTVEKSFDGPPIFRGKKVYVTGRFIHGTIIDVCNIIQSYAATATTVFSTDVNCVLVGGMNEQAPHWFPGRSHWVGGTNEGVGPAEPALSSCSPFSSSQTTGPRLPYLGF